MSESKHTPTPWRISGTSSHRVTGKHGVLANCGNDSTHSAVEDQCAANAAFIVRACNAHEELLEALQKIATCESQAPGDVVDIARAAIAKARSEAA